VSTIVESAALQCTNLVDWNCSSQVRVQSRHDKSC